MITSTNIIIVTAIVICFLLFALGVVSGAWKTTTNTRYTYINKPYMPRLPRESVDLLNVVVVTLYCVTVLACVAGTIGIMATR